MNYLKSLSLVLIALLSTAPVSAGTPSVYTGYKMTSEEEKAFQESKSANSTPTPFYTASQPRIIENGETEFYARHVFGIWSIRSHFSDAPHVTNSNNVANAQNIRDIRSAAEEKAYQEFIAGFMSTITRKSTFESDCEEIELGHYIPSFNDWKRAQEIIELLDESPIQMPKIEDVD